MEEKENSNTKKISSSKVNFTLKSENTSYDFTLITKEDELTFKFEDLKEFPVKLYELKIQFEKFRQLNENFMVFKRPDRFVGAIKRCIQSENYSVSFNKDENEIIFEIKNELFEDGGAKINIPEQKQSLETQVESLTKTVSELRKEILSLKNRELEKDEAAIKSFQGTTILKDEEKKIISKWIHQNKVISFNMLYSTDKDGDSASTFHYYCDGIFPTLTVILDTSGRKFGGYTTQSWLQHSASSSYARGQGSFIFNLSKNKKFGLVNQINTNAIYKHNSYGPTFGGGHDIVLYNSCKSNNNSYCNKNSYNSGETNILGENGTTKFQVTSYEVYQVIFE